MRFALYNFKKLSKKKKSNVITMIPMAIGRRSLPAAGR